MQIFLLFVAINALSLACVSSSGIDKMPRKEICGLTFVAPPQPFSSDPMTSITGLGCNWIAVVPYAFTPPQKPEVRFGSQRWWGEREEGVIETIQRAHAAGLKVMLKPQVWSRGWWTGDYHFETGADWQQWEKGYTTYILNYAHIADSANVDLFCIGTEFKNALRHRPHYWDELIDTIRTIYKGALTYASNWDEYEEFPFWEKLDYVGINAYFPLTSDEHPQMKHLLRAWKPYMNRIRSLHEKTGKPVIFTEYGYLSVDGATTKTWELEKKLDQLNVNQEIQALAVDALHLVFSTESYWKGGFLWKWYPEMRGHEGYPAKDYTPQGKLAEQVLKRWFTP